MREALRELASRRDHAAVVVLCAIVVVVHQLVRWHWFIDDAGIVFSYARNLAAGEGIVARPGGERIEGVSDPLWVVLLALFQVVRIDGFTIAKPLGMLFAVLTLPLVWKLSRLAMPRYEGPAPLFAPLFLALNSQLALWSTSGLENGMFVFLLCWAILRTIEDASTGRPWSALLWLALTWTRPEGLLYAAAGGLWFMVWTAKDGRPTRPALQWVALLAIPTLVVEALRVWYFAWALPNTWYAKIESREAQRFSWDARGWTQVREWAADTWNGWLAPLYVAGLAGTRGRRATLVLATVGFLGLTLLWPGPDALRDLSFWPTLPPTPDWYEWARVGLIVGVGAALPWWAAHRPRSRPLVMCWHTAFVAIVFSVYADGDWMGGFRWMSLMVGPLSVLFASGVKEVADRVERSASGSALQWGAAGWTTAAVLVASQLPPNFTITRDHKLHNTNETPARVKMRVDYTSSIARRLFVDEPIVNLDMDMGAHLWWRPDSVDVDMAGLVDIPMSRHTYKDRAFIEQYVFGEQRPMFGHVHGWWAKFSGFPTYGAWQDEYFELPPYQELPGMPLPEKHVGVWARRDLLMTHDLTPDPERTARFDRGPAVLDVEAPAPWGAGRRAYFEIKVLPPEGDPPPRFRLIAFLVSGRSVVASFELPMGHGLLPIGAWRPGEAFVGRYALPVPAGLAPGRYDVGVVALGARGVVRGSDPPASEFYTPAFARGEVIWPRVVEVVANDVAVARADEMAKDAIAHAGAGACGPAEQTWRLARLHLPWDDGWADAHAPAIDSALASCWANRATVEPKQAAKHLARAHRWDRENETLREVGSEVGAQLWREGREARSAGNWAVAYDRFSSLLQFQPWRAWARRYAEEARDHVLANGTTPES